MSEKIISEQEVRERVAHLQSAIRDDILSKMDHQPSKGELGVVDNLLGCLR